MKPLKYETERSLTEQQVPKIIKTFYENSHVHFVDMMFNETTYKVEQIIGTQLRRKMI